MLATTHPELAEQWGPGNDRTPEDVTYGSQYKAEWVGPCGHTWHATVQSRASRSQGCPYCAPNPLKILSGFNDLATRYPDVASQWHPSRNTVTPSEVTGATGKKAWWLGSCGHEWESPVYNRTIGGQGCPFCTGKRVLAGFNDLATTNPELLPEWHPDNEKTPQEVTAGSHYRARWVCSKGHEWEVKVQNRAKQGSGCAVCSGRVVSPGFNDLATLNPGLAAQWHPDNDKGPGDVSPGSNHKVKWMCASGHEWAATVIDRRMGTGCPQCGRWVSTPETELAEWLSTVTTVETSNRSLIHPMELDIYLPERSVAIEFNGLYWHTEKRVGRSKHLSKTQACEEAGVTLIHVWEDDWKYRKEVVKKTLLRKIGLSDEMKVNARDLTCSPATSKEARVFLDENHIQGYAAGRSYALRDGEGVIRAVLVVKHRKEGPHEIIRFATNALVRGGFTKLLAYVEKQLDVQEWVTFAARDVSTGRLYESSGFTVSGETPPDYWYVVGDRREHKFNYRKDRFRKDPYLLYADGLTERQLAELNGLERIYDAGKIRYSKVVY